MTEIALGANGILRIRRQEHFLPSPINPCPDNPVERPRTQRQIVPADAQRGDGIAPWPEPGSVASRKFDASQYTPGEGEILLELDVGEVISNEREIARPELAAVITRPCVGAINEGQIELQRK